MFAFFGQETFAARPLTVRGETAQNLNAHLVRSQEKDLLVNC
jgi:hypothetical protein